MMASAAEAAAAPTEAAAAAAAGDKKAEASPQGGARRRLAKERKGFGGMDGGEGDDDGVDVDAVMEAATAAAAAAATVSPRLGHREVRCDSTTYAAVCFLCVTLSVGLDKGNAGRAVVVPMVWGVVSVEGTRLDHVCSV